jgi:hypothetical protein
MNIELAGLFGGNEGLLLYFGQQAHADVILIIEANFGHWQNFVNMFRHKKSIGCTCESFHDMMNSDCNPCYKYLVEQDVCNLINMRDFYPEDYTKEMRDEYIAIVRECNLRQIKMNEFVMH